jgi:hypothetical protein
VSRIGPPPAPNGHRRWKVPRVTGGATNCRCDHGSRLTVVAAVGAARVSKLGTHLNFYASLRIRQPAGSHAEPAPPASWAWLAQKAARHAPWRAPCVLRRAACHPRSASRRPRGARGSLMPSTSGHRSVKAVSESRRRTVVGHSIAAAAVLGMAKLSGSRHGVWKKRQRECRDSPSAARASRDPAARERRR